MVNEELVGARAAERQVALSYASSRARRAIAALLALDTTLGMVVRTTHEPLIGQMRLTWWHDALVALDTAPAPAEPVLRALAAELVAPGFTTGAELATVVEGWEALLDPLNSGTVDRAAERGARVFRIVATVLGETSAAVAGAGRGWAFADLSLQLSDAASRDHARNRGRAALAAAFDARWPRRLRVLGALALLAQDDLSDAPHPPAGLHRVLRLLRHRIDGR